MEHKLYSGLDIQNAFKSTIILINEISDVTGQAPIAIKNKQNEGFCFDAPLFFLHNCRLWGQLFI